MAELDFAFELGEEMRKDEEASNTYSNATVALTLVGGTVNAPLKPQRFNASVKELFISDLCEWLGCIESSALSLKDVRAVEPPEKITSPPPNPRKSVGGGAGAAGAPSGNNGSVLVVVEVPPRPPPQALPPPP